MIALSEVLKTIEDIRSHGLDFGDQVYKICPKCNSHHNSTCDHCAWQGTMRVCHVGVGVYPDGSYNEKPLQITQQTLGPTMDHTFYELWNVQYFPSREAAERALSEYEEIRNIKDKTVRYRTYLHWYAQQRFPWTPVDNLENL